MSARQWTVTDRSQSSQPVLFALSGRWTVRLDPVIYLSLSGSVARRRRWGVLSFVPGLSAHLDKGRDMKADSTGLQTPGLLSAAGVLADEWSVVNGD